MKKLFALVLALIMVMSLATTAFAVSGGNDDTGSITIDKAHVGATYSIYQILKLISYDTSINSYIYEPATTDWEDFVATNSHLSVKANGTVEWAGPTTDAAKNAFIAEALAYAEANGIDPSATPIKKETEGQVVKFENLNLGYYVVDSSIGALCSLDTVMPDSVIEEKNLVPTNKKEVRGNDGLLTENTTAKIGQTVEFVSTITVYAGTHNLAFHDRMQPSLDYNVGSVVVYKGMIKDENIVPATNYVVTETGLTDVCTFEVAFNETFMDTITEATELFVSYKATLNEKAVLAPNANVNESMITYGDDGKSNWDPANVLTYQFGIVKTDISNNILNGAKFELYYSATGDDKIALVKETPVSVVPLDGVNYYRPATDAEKAAPGFVSAEIEAGVAIIWGARSGVAMYLKETQAPVGYNELAERYHITALTDNNMPTFNMAEKKYTSGGIEIENLAGAQLPQTGGMGTTLFYVFGTILVAAAVVLLVTKKRMVAEN